jgi:putative FmdB family regulatory protein
MPIYAYRCGSCGFEQDVMQKLSASPLTTCPECKAESFAKQLTAPGFQLKGSGWYATDFKGGAKTGAAASAGASSTDSVSGDAPKADAAPTCAGGSCACH